MALGMPDVCEPGHSHAAAPHAAVLHKAAVQRGPPRLLREQLAAHAQPLVSPAHAGFCRATDTDCGAGGRKEQLGTCAQPRAGQHAGTRCHIGIRGPLTVGRQSLCERDCRETRVGLT